MKLSISNIAWTGKDDEYFYEKLKILGYKGLEIAPTRIFPENPYEHILEAGNFAHELYIKYSLEITSMQSIWFGRNEEIFDTDASRELLINYTKKAIDFASAMNCRNLVFGCPRNRNIKSPDQMPIAFDFFKRLGDYAFSKNTVMAFEPNPVIYNTNFINYTSEAFDLVKKVDCPGFLVNIDLGTIIHNQEKISDIDFLKVNHIHISEPGMLKPEKRELHVELFKTLNESSYNKFVSIEMKTQENLQDVEDTLLYVKELNHEY